jgi:phosphatidylglycerophosphatase A
VDARLLAVKKAVATLGGAGYAPVAPGTAGSAVAAVGYYFLCGSLGPLGWAVLLLAAMAVGIAAATGLEEVWGKDPSPVVIDEAAGLLFTVALLPHGAVTAIAGFLLFRVLDILKPPPVRQLERLPGAWGIMADDVAVGILGNLLLRAGLLWAGAA